MGSVSVAPGVTGPFATASVTARASGGAVFPDIVSKRPSFNNEIAPYLGQRMMAGHLDCVPTMRFVYPTPAGSFEPLSLIVS